MGKIKAARLVLVNTIAFIAIDKVLQSAGIEAFSTHWIGVFALVCIAIFNAIA